MDNTISVNDLMGKDWTIALAPSSRQMHFRVYVECGKHKVMMHARHIDFFTSPGSYSVALHFTMGRIETDMHLVTKSISEALCDRLAVLLVLEGKVIKNMVFDKIKDGLTIEQKAELADWFLDGCTYLRRYL